MNSEQIKQNKIEKLLNLGYDLDSVTKYLNICNGDLDKTLELLLVDNMTVRDINIDPDILTTALNDESTKWDIDQHDKMVIKLKKYETDESVIKDALEESNGNFNHARTILINKNLRIKYSDTDSE